MGRLLKLLLWLQFLGRGMIRSFLRYYAGVWTSASLVLGGSIGLMLESPKNAAAAFGPVWLMLTLCAVAILVAYLLARFLGPAPLVAICVALPGIFIITPQTSGSADVAIQTRGDEGVLLMSGESILGTGDFQLFLKGSLVSSFLVAACYLVFRMLQTPPVAERLSLRWSTALAITVVGIGVLELLRELTGVYPGLRMPWQPLVARVMREPGWPKAICIWIWLAVPLLVAMYEDRLIPYLLYRTGHQWAPARISLQDAFMIDSLLAAMADLRKKGKEHDRSRSSSRRMRPRHD